MNNTQLFRQFLSNKFKGGGKKHKKSSYNESSFMQDYNTAWKGTRYDTPEWKAFWTKLAKRESSFNPQIMNSIGAKGYFQLMPSNRSANWQNNIQQFAEADKLIRRMEASLTQEDLKKAESLGLDKYALLAGAWLGGIGGVRAALRGKTKADKNGTTVMSRMKDFNNLSVSQPQIDPIEQYLNTTIGTHIIDNPIYTEKDLTSNSTSIVDSNTPVSEVEEDNTTALPKVVVQEVSPQRKDIIRSLIDYSMNNQPKIASILVDNNTPTIIDKLAVLSKDDADKITADINDKLLRQNIESNLTNSQFNHFFTDNVNTQNNQTQDFKSSRAINNTVAYGGDINCNIFETGGPFSLGIPAIPGLIIRQKLKQLFSKEPEKKPRNAKTDRKRNNTSPTARRSESIENQMYEFLPKNRSSYDIPFIPEKAILINGYTTSTNALDSLAKYAGIHNRTLQVSENPIRRNSKTRPVTKEEALGLSLRETKGGALPYSNDSRTSGDKEAKRAFYNANVFTAFQDIPATALVNDYHYNKTSQSVPPLLDAFQYYAQGDYNRGDSNHTADVRKAGNTAFQNPKVVDWWNNEGKYWFNGTYQNVGDDVKKKALGGNLFYDGGNENDEDIKATIASQWPATSKVDYSLKPQEGFFQFIDENGNPRGTIETITPNQVAATWSPVYAKMNIPINKRPLLEETNRVDYRDYDSEGNPIGEILIGKNYITTNQPGQNTIVYNPQYTNIEDIKQDLLHVMHDDPEYEKLYNIYMTEALNDMDFLYHDFSEGDQRAVEDMMNGTFSKPTDENIERGLNADSMLQAQLDGYLREQLYSGTPEERIAAGYTGIPYAIKNPSLVKAINNIKGYLEQKALGGVITHPTTEKDKYAHGGFKGNIYETEGGYLFKDGGGLENKDTDIPPIPFDIPLTSFDISIEDNNEPIGVTSKPIEKTDNTPQKPLMKSYGAVYEKPFVENRNQFLDNWLNKRSDILQNNITSAGINTTAQQELDRQLGNLNKTIEITSTIPDYLDSENLAILGYDAARESKDKNVKNAASAVKGLIKEANKQGGYDYNGIYSPKENVIFYPERLSADTMVHERTHALQATPQKRAIQKLLDAGDYLQEGQTPDDYYDNPSEIYSRLMEFRLNAGINPEDRFNNRLDIFNKAVDPNYRKESFERFKQTGDYRNLIGRYKTDFLLKLLNDIAQNDMNNDNVNYAANGGSINIKPSRKGTFTAAAKRHGKGVQEFATHVLANKEDLGGKFADGGPEKNAIVSYAKLDTYYPFISDYPYTGHSSLNITDTIEGHKSNKTITNRFRNKGYNLLTNNCSDATREALEKTFNQKLNPFLFTTPGDVQDFALEKLHGVPEVKGDSIFIPNEGKYVLNTKKLKSKKLRKGLSTVFIPVTQKQKETLINIYKDNIYKNNLGKLLKYKNDNRTRKKALGGPLFNSRTPIESFQGGKQLPIVRY